jgi:hypothetical protein
MIEPTTISDAAALVYNATKDAEDDSRISFDQLIEVILGRKLLVDEKERAWYEYMGLMIMK